MAKGCGLVVKWLLMVFNLVFFISGLGILVVGCIAEVNFRQYDQVLGRAATSVPILLIVIGCVVMAISFLGCAGAIRESFGMLITFAVLMVIIFILEIAGGIAAYVDKAKFYGVMKEQLTTTIEGYNPSETETDKNADDFIWDHVQENLHCCGTYEYGYWGNNTLLKRSGAVPDSCCKNVTYGCGKGVLRDPVLAKRMIYEDVANEGCIQAFEAWLDKNSTTVGAVGVGIAFLQVLGIIFACVLAKMSKQSSKYDTV